MSTTAQTHKRRVVVTGLGTVNALGLNVQESWAKVAAGQSGIGRITTFDPTPHQSHIGGEVKGFDPETLFGRRDARRMDRATQYAVAAAQEAVQSAQIDQLSEAVRHHIGVYIGNGLAGIGTIEEACTTLLQRGPGRVSPHFIPMMLGDSIPARISMFYGLRGPNMAIATACASATNAIGEAFRLIADGRAEIMLAGGAETGVVPLSLAGFDAMGALSTRNSEPERASRPFDAGRDGFVPADGAAVLVLEELNHALARQVHIYGEIVGYGTTADAFHVSAPREDGAGGVEAMQLALQEAGLRPEQVDYVNAHGTSTPLNDKMETTALKTLFGEHAYNVPISSTKSMHGHLLGAAGALEMVLCFCAIEQQLLPPTINYETPDADCDLDYVPNQARPGKIEVVMSNSFGFGGHNATLIGRKYGNGTK